MADATLMTSTAIRYAIYDEKYGGYLAKKNTHRGCTDFWLLNNNLEPKVFKTAEQALHARSDKTYGWYH